MKFLLILLGLASISEVIGQTASSDRAARAKEASRRRRRQLA
jgi:hypothetical protein